MKGAGRTFLPNRNRIWPALAFFLSVGLLPFYLPAREGRFPVLLLLFVGAGLRYASFLTLRYCIGADFRIRMSRWVRRVVPLREIIYIGKPTRFWFKLANHSAAQRRNESVEIGYSDDGDLRRLVVGPRERDKFIAALAVAAKTAGATPLVDVSVPPAKPLVVAAGAIVGAMAGAVSGYMVLALIGEGFHSNELSAVLAFVGLPVGAVVGVKVGVRVAKGRGERRKDSARRRLRWVLVLATAAIPIWLYVRMPKVDYREYVLPLSAEERQLRNTAHFAMSVAVENPRCTGRLPLCTPMGTRFYPAYERQLIHDLRETGLFDRVGALGMVTSPDLVATLDGAYYGDRFGQSFRLRLARRPDRDEHIKVGYVQRGILAAVGERRRYLDRLALETIRKVQALTAAPQ